MLLTRNRGGDGAFHNHLFPDTAARQGCTAKLVFQDFWRRQNGVMCLSVVKLARCRGAVWSRPQRRCNYLSAIGPGRTPPC